MQIKNAQLIPYSLPLRQAWRSASGEFTERKGWSVVLTTDNDLTGYGDCAPLTAAGTEPAEAAKSALERSLPRLIRLTPEQALKELKGLKNTSAAGCAIETALLDLISQHHHLPMRHWLNPNAIDELSVNGMLGTLSPTSIDDALILVDQGYEVLKLKVGVGDLNEEIDTLASLCQKLPPENRLRLDANRAWRLEQAQYFLDGIATLPIESLEEPLQQPTSENLSALQNQTPISLALDETVADMQGDTLLRHCPVRRIILKPMALGGLLYPHRLATEAIKQGIEVVITTTVDSAYGVAAASQLAAAIAPLQPKIAHGLATSGWLERDLGYFSDVQAGYIHLPDIYGLGVIRH